MCTTSSTNSNAEGVECMATNLAIGDVPKAITKKKKMKRKMIIIINGLKVCVITVVRRDISAEIAGRRKTAIIKNLIKEKKPLTEMSWCNVH